MSSTQRVLQIAHATSLIRDEKELMDSVNIREQRNERLGRKKGGEGRTSWEESKTA